MTDYKNIPDMPLKTPLDPLKDQLAIRDLQLAALTIRRKILYMGHRNRIKLHYGALLSMVELVTTLYMHWLNIDPQNPEWPGRDRFVLSKGHGAPALYIGLWMRGFLHESNFDGFRRLHSILQGHPDHLKTPGVDCSSGSLGQGMPVSCGMALGAKIDDAPYRVYAYMSDGECNEGSIWEAAQIASNLGLDRLTVIVDWNRKSSYGFMAGRNDIEPLRDKWLAFNWAVFECDGHDFVSISRALFEADAVQGRPSVVLAHTVKGKGIPYVEFYETKAHILLTQEKYEECLTHLDQVEEKIVNG